MKRSTTLTTLALVAVLLAGATSSAAMKREFVLEPVGPMAAEMTAIGQVAKVQKFEQFKIRLFADVKDGTGFVVLVQRRDPSIGSAKLIPVGKLEIQLGSGMVNLNTKQHVSKAFPVMGLDRVVIQLKGRTVLEGRVFDLTPTGN